MKWSNPLKDINYQRSLKKRDNLNSSISFQECILIYSWKLSHKETFQANWLHWWILSKILPNMFRKVKARERIPPESLTRAPNLYQNRVKMLQKKKVKTETLYKHRCKNSRRNFSKLNPTRHTKDKTLRANGHYFGNWRLVQHSQFNQYNLSSQQTEK